MMNLHAATELHGTGRIVWLRAAVLGANDGRHVKAVELARVVIVGQAADGTIKLFNREAERVTGFARDEALAVHLHLPA